MMPSSPNDNLLADNSDSQASLKWYNLLYDSFTRPIKTIRYAAENYNCSLYKKCLWFCIISLTILSVFGKMCFPLMYFINPLFVYLGLGIFMSFMLLPMIYFLMLDVTFRILSFIKKNVSDNSKTDVSCLTNYDYLKTLCAVLNGTAPSLVIFPIAAFLIFSYALIAQFFNNQTLLISIDMITIAYILPIMIMFWFSWTYFVFRSFNFGAWLNALYALVLLVINSAGFYIILTCL